MISNVTKVTHSFSESCGPGVGWSETPFKKCFKYVKTPIATWATAQANCQREGGRLVIADDADQIQYLKDIRTYKPGAYYFHSQYKTSVVCHDLGWN